jgi:hypothetical protein
MTLHVYDSAKVVVMYYNKFQLIKVRQNVKCHRFTRAADIIQVSRKAGTKQDFSRITEWARKQPMNAAKTMNPSSPPPTRK